MPGRTPKKPVSQAQARFFGAVAGGNSNITHHGLTAEDAKKKLKGADISKLPEKKKEK